MYTFPWRLAITLCWLDHARCILMSDIVHICTWQWKTRKCKYSIVRAGRRALGNVLNTTVRSQTKNKSVDIDILVLFSSRLSSVPDGLGQSGDCALFLAENLLRTKSKWWKWRNTVQEQSVNSKQSPSLSLPRPWVVFCKLAANDDFHIPYF